MVIYFKGTAEQTRKSTTESNRFNLLLQQRTKMQSCAWMNGQYRQVGPPSQSSQAADQFTQFNTQSNQQTGTANTTTVRPPQGANFTYRNGAYSNRQPSNRQTSALPHQEVSYQHPAGENTHFLKMLTGHLQHSSTNTQSGNPSSLVTYGFQQDFHHQNSAQNSSTQSPPNMMIANATYPQQNMSAQWNQSVRVHGNHSIGTQNGNVVPDLQHRGDQNSLFYSVNGESTKSVSGKSTTATSHPQQMVCMGTLVPVAAHSRQTAHNHNQRPNGTQHGFSPSIPPPSYRSACQSFGGNSITTKSSSSLQHLNVFSMSQKTPQYSTYNSGVQATSSFPSNSYSRQYETSPEFPLHPAVGTQERMHSQQIIARIADDLRNSFPAGSDGHPPVYSSSPDGRKQFVSEVSRMKSNQNMQPLTTTVTASYASQLVQLLNVTSPHRDQTQSSVANNCERLEKLSSVKANDSSIHSSPGRTRAVAVVQPLSHESYQVVSQQTCLNKISELSEGTTTDESLSNPGKLLISPKNNPAVYSASNLYLENPNQNGSNESAAEPQDSQKQLCPDDTGSELQVDQHVAQPAQQLVTSEVPVSQSRDKGESKMPKDANKVFELSSLPATPLTHVALTKLIEVAEKSKIESSDNAKSVSVKKLLDMYWNGNCTELACKLRTGWYRNLMRDVLEFHQEHLTPDSVILSYVKRRNKLNSYHVLKHNEVYSELPYKSLWLNVNEQLDDIDKEFGLPQSLKHHLYTLESASQPDQVETNDGIFKEVSNKISSNELNPVGSREEKQDATVEATLTQAASPNTMESAESSDPCYSFEIQVLSPEKAKVIFEQIQTDKQKLPQSMGMDNQLERVTESSLDDELPEVIYATKLENESACSIEQVCCIPRWKQMIWGSNTASLSKCQCEYKQSHFITHKIFDKEEMDVQRKDKLCVISSDSQFNFGTEEGNQAEDGENVNSQVITLHWPELCNELGYTIDFTEDDKKPHSYSDKEPQNISQISINSSQSSITLISENEDDLSSSKNDIPNQKPDFESDSERAPVELTESSQSSCSDEKETNSAFKSDTEIQPDLEVDCVQDQLKSSMQSCTLVSSDCSESEVASKMSDLSENCGQARLTSTTVTEPSLENEEEQTQVSTTDALQKAWSGKHETVERKRKRSSSQDQFFPIFNKSKKCKSLADGEFSASNVRTVELVPYGSTSQNNCVLISGRKSHISYPEVVSGAAPKPPKVITVKLSPLKRMSSETVPTGRHTVKRNLYDKWSRSLPPTKIRHRSKLKAMCTFASFFGGGLKKAKTAGPANTQQLQVSSEMRTRNGNTKPCLSLKRRRTLSNGLKRGEERTKKYTVTLGQPAKQERSVAENGGRPVPPLQNNVLKFSVLPNTFNFKDGSNGTKETNDPVTDKADLVEGKDQSQNKTVTSARGTWFPNPEKKYSPLTKTGSVFYEFQKKYMERTQPSMDG
ncbi:uncharacterized protein si:ch211-106e7.2 isoform X2 [Sander lucioperca]|uniref:uncharacterized protein si:ch211-106e7.2 isoform X2 n=1 Tax=Sander lucioperca TaxID=283035 RepID=UPI00125DCBF3|nr:uncharacterized protein si:ch211-106e7.2 isoform X2 [Sander lucioperca]